MTNIEFVEFNIASYLHDKAIRAFGGEPGLRDKGLFESAMLRPVNKLTYVGVEHSDVFDLAAAYAFGLVKNHTFNDGNKRTAWAVAVMFLNLNGVVVDVPTNDAVANVVRLANSSLSEDEFAVWLRSFSQPPGGDADL